MTYQDILSKAPKGHNINPNNLECIDCKSTPEMRSFYTSFDICIMQRMRRFVASLTQDECNIIVKQMKIDKAIVA